MNRTIKTTKRTTKTTGHTFRSPTITKVFNAVSKTPGNAAMIAKLTGLKRVYVTGVFTQLYKRGILWTKPGTGVYGLNKTVTMPVINKLAKAA